jgi:hypothetical protein
MGQSPARRFRQHVRGRAWAAIALTALLTAAPAVPSATAYPAAGHGSSNAQGGGHQVRLFVDPDAGRDYWPGTEARPLRTVHGAQRAVRALPTTHGRVEINLRAGTHALKGPLVLRGDRADSGLPGQPIVYQAYGYGTRRQENVILSGGRRVTGWIRSGDGTWAADIGSVETRHLFVNGKRATLAKLGTGIPGNVVTTETGYITTSVAPQGWANPADIELVYTGAFPWSEPRCGVAGITGDADSTTITMDEPCFSWSQKLFARDWGGVHEPMIDPTDVQNSRSFLQQPGTFYVDRSVPGHHRLLYVPRAGEDMGRAHAVAGVLETLIEGRGTAAERVHDVQFKGIEFAHTTWLAPAAPTGFVHYWAHTYYSGGEINMGTGDFPTNEDLLSVPGSLAFRHSDRITFEGNRFERLGAAALEFSHDSGYNSVVGNVFTDISAGGVWIGASAPEVGGANPGNRVANNWVHNIGIEFLGSTGILLQGTQDSVVEHNQVNDVPYSGIVLAHSGDLENVGPATTGQKALNNYVFDALNVLHDGGGIYITGPQGSSWENGSLTEGNVVHDAPYIGIYTDFFTTFNTVRRNVSYDVTYSSGGYCPISVRFESNFWDNENVAYADDCAPPWPEVTYEDNTLLDSADPAAECRATPACGAILDNAGLEPTYRHLLGQ